LSEETKGIMVRHDAFVISNAPVRFSDVKMYK